MHENAYTDSAPVFAPNFIVPILIRDVFSHKLCFLNIALFFPSSSNLIQSLVTNLTRCIIVKPIYPRKASIFRAKIVTLLIGDRIGNGPRIRPIGERETLQYIDRCIYLFDTVVGGTRVQFSFDSIARATRKWFYQGRGAQARVVSIESILSKWISIRNGKKKKDSEGNEVRKRRKRVFLSMAFDGT